jgi:hypothetical protein
LWGLRLLMLSCDCVSLMLDVRIYTYGPIIVSARSKASTVFALSSARIVGSNPTQSMGVCIRLFCFCVVLCVDSGLATG